MSYQIRVFFERLINLKTEVDTIDYSPMRKPFTAVIDRERTSRLIYDNKIFCTTLF